MHEIIPEAGNVVRVKVSGKLTQADYDELIPSWEQVIARHGSMRMLFEMENFRGWEPSAAWDDFPFGWAHGKKVERIAMVGEKTWQEWMARLASLFVSEEVKYLISGSSRKRSVGFMPDECFSR